MPPSLKTRRRAAPGGPDGSLPKTLRGAEGPSSPPAVEQVRERFEQPAQQRALEPVPLLEAKVSLFGETPQAPEGLRREKPFRSWTELELQPQAEAPLPDREDPLWDDAEAVFQWVLRRPAALEHASPRLRDDLCIVQAACYQWGPALQYASERLQANKELVLAAVRDSAEALRFASEPLKRDPDVARAALHEAPARALEVLPADALSPEARLWKAALAGGKGRVEGLEPGWNKDIPLLLSVAARSQAVARVVLEWADPSLLRDKAFHLALVSRWGFLVRELPSPFDRDPDLWVAAVHSDPELIRLAPPSQRVRAELWDAALEGDPTVFQQAPAEVRGNPERALRVVARHAEAASALPPTLLGDVAFLAACVEVNPLSLDHLPEPARQQVRAEFPEVAQLHAKLLATLADLDITRLELFKGNWPLLRQLIHNRTHSAGDDTRPLAVVVMAKQDDTGAFRNHSLEQLSKFYRIAYHETATDTGMVRAIKRATADKKASLLILCGHGNRTLTSFGAADPAKEDVTRLARETLGLDDGALLASAELERSMEDGAAVVLMSCSTGEGQNREQNVANLLAQTIPNATVYAPRVSTGGRVEVDAHGRFVSPGYDLPRGQTYVVPPRVRTGR